MKKLCRIWLMAMALCMVWLGQCFADAGMVPLMDMDDQHFVAQFNNRGAGNLNQHVAFRGTDATIRLMGFQPNEGDKAMGFDIYTSEIVAADAKCTVTAFMDASYQINGLAISAVCPEKVMKPEEARAMTLFSYSTNLVEDILGLSGEEKAKIQTDYYQEGREVYVRCEAAGRYIKKNFMRVQNEDGSWTFTVMYVAITI